MCLCVCVGLCEGVVVRASIITFYLYLNVCILMNKELYANIHSFNLFYAVTVC